MNPSESLSSSADFPVFPVIRLPAPLLSEAGRGGPLQSLGASLPSCCCFNPAGAKRRISQIATLRAAFAHFVRARPPGTLVSRPNLHSLSLRPDDSLTILKDGFVDRLQRFGFSPPCYPSYKASDYYLDGTHLPLNTLAFAGRTQNPNSNQTILWLSHLQSDGGCAISHTWPTSRTSANQQFLLTRFNCFVFALARRPWVIRHIELRRLVAVSFETCLHPCRNAPVDRTSPPPRD